MVLLVSEVQIGPVNYWSCLNTMLIEQLIDIKTLIKRIQEIKSDHPNKKSTLEWALLTSDEL